MCIMNEVKTSKDDFALLLAIMGRFKAEIGVEISDQLSLMMDLEVCHHFNPLDLERFAGATPSDLAHDVCGIANHINRETGQLGRGFVPRFSKEQ